MLNSINSFKQNHQSKLPSQQQLNLKNINPRSSYQEEHSVYFQKLQQQLLQRSNRYTSLIGKKAFAKVSSHQTVLEKIQQNKSGLLKNIDNQIKPSTNSSFSTLSQLKKGNLQQISNKQTDSKTKQKQLNKKTSPNKIYSSDFSVKPQSQLELLKPKRCVSRQQTQRSTTEHDKTNQKEQEITYTINVHHNMNRKQINAQNQCSKLRLANKRINIDGTDKANAIKNNSEFKSKIAVKIDHIKDMLKVYNQKKRKDQKDTSMQLHRRLVYNLTFEDNNPSLLQDSPQKVKVNDREKIILGSHPIGIVFEKVKDQKSKSLDSLLGQTASTKISFNQGSNQSSKVSIFRENLKDKKQVNQQKIQKNFQVQAKQKSAQNQINVGESNEKKNMQTNFKKEGSINSQAPSFVRSSLRSCQYNEINMSIRDFIILAEIGEGKIGIVYMAKHIKSNFICALKVINRQIINEHVAVQLIREIQIQFYLDHPNIVQLYAFFSDRQNIYLMMELCFSGNLYTHLRREKILPQSQIRSIIKQVCHALQYMHDNQILHRDLKPQNILFHQNIIKICDFGWAVYSPLPRDTLCGTPLYASPQLVQKKMYNNKIDVWGVGILTFELLCGRVPFQIRSEEDLYKVVIQDVHYPKFIPASEVCKDFVDSCVNKLPQKRKTISQLLDHPFLNQHN